MADRLSHLAHSHAQSLSQTTMQHVGPGHSGGLFNPRSVSFDIRSPEELAAVNDFLITLGRDVTAPPNAMRNMHDPSEYGQSPQSYFDAAGLAQLGLAGMPGVPSAPGSGAGYHGDGGYSSGHALVNPLPQTAYPSRAAAHPSLQSVQYNTGLYPSVPDLDFAAPGPSSSYQPQHRQRVSLSPPYDEYTARPAFHQPTPTHFLSPPYDPTAGGASPMSSHSQMSTPPNATPPHLSDLHSFDYMRPSRAPPAVQLAPVDYAQRTMRTIVPLRAAGARDAANLAPAEPVEPKLTAPSFRRGPLKLTSEYPASAASASPSSSSSSVSSASSASSRAASPTAARRSDSLYSHLLKDGDAQYRLPPIGAKYRAPPSPASTASPLSRASTLSPPPRRRSRSPEPASDAELDRAPADRAAATPPTLPPIRDLARGVGRLALDGSKAAAPKPPQPLSAAQRRLHAELLRDMLLAINGEYQRRFGRAAAVRVKTEEREVGVVEGRRRLEGEGMRDVEMAAA